MKSIFIYTTSILAALLLLSCGKENSEQVQLLTRERDSLKALVQSGGTAQTRSFGQLTSQKTQPVLWDTIRHWVSQYQQNDDESIVAFLIKKEALAPYQHDQIAYLQVFLAKTTGQSSNLTLVIRGVTADG